MDPSTAIAVVSLAIQLAGTVQSISEFLRTVRDAPSEINTMIETMDIAQGNFNQVHYLIEQQFSDARLAGSPVFILNALRTCEKRVETLKTLVEEIKKSLGTSHSLKRTWASLNIRPKKLQLRELQSRLRDAMSNLHFAILTNQCQLQVWQLQLMSTLHQSQMTISSNICKPLNVIEDGLSIIQRSTLQHSQHNEESTGASSVSRATLPMISREQNTIWYQGMFGFVTMREKSIRIATSEPRKKKKPGFTEKIIFMTPWFLRRGIELYFGASFASVPRALRVYQVVDFTAPIFEMSRWGDLEGIQNEFANGNISPFVVDDEGSTLLHAAASKSQTEMCCLLLRLGLDADHVDIDGKKAFQYLGSRDEASVLDTMRTLAQAQEEFSSTEVSEYLKYILCSPVVTEYILSLKSVRYDLISAEWEENLYPALGAALMQYGKYFNRDSLDAISLLYFPLARWESVIRKLLRIGVDIHAPIVRYDSLHQVIPDLYGTPLDELFAYTRTAGEAKEAADAWLQILSKEGIDVLAYLEKEKALHATQSMLTCPEFGLYDDDPPRKLVFSLGETPTVYADWWIDPESSTYLIRQEFKHMNIFFREDDTLFSVGSWPGDGGDDYLREVEWPISYPRWSDSFEPWSCPSEEHATWKRLSELAQERANRRWQKKVRKTGRLNDTQVHFSMPGAWPEK